MKPHSFNATTIKQNKIKHRMTKHSLCHILFICFVFCLFVCFVLFFGGDKSRTHLTHLRWQPSLEKRHYSDVLANYIGLYGQWPTGMQRGHLLVSVPRYQMCIFRYEIKLPGRKWCYRMPNSLPHYVNDSQFTHKLWHGSIATHKQWFPNTNETTSIHIRY